MRELYTVEYYNDKYDRQRDYVLAKSKEEALEKFAKHHPEYDGYSHVVNWQRINY